MHAPYKSARDHELLVVIEVVELRGGPQTRQQQRHPTVADVDQPYRCACLAPVAECRTFAKHQLGLGVVPWQHLDDAIARCARERADAAGQRLRRIQVPSLDGRDKPFSDVVRDCGGIRPRPVALPTWHQVAQRVTKQGQRPCSSSSTARRFAASETISSVPLAPDGCSTCELPPPPEARSANSADRPGPRMSLRTVRGASHAIHGRRTNALGDSSRLRMADRTCCWRFARARSSSFGAHLFSRTREYCSAWCPVRC